MWQKHLIILSLLSSPVMAQECFISEKTVSNDSGQVAVIKNVTAEVVPWGKGQQKCIVNLEGSVKSKWSKASGEFIWDGDYSSSKACGAAVELAKKNLLASLNYSTISIESVIICREHDKVNAPVINPKIGTILSGIGGLRLNPNFSKFYHNGEECRWYLETGWNGKDITQFNGIVCKYGPTKWIIVDKF